MRTVFHEELQTLVDQLVEMTKLVEGAMTGATQALLTADLDLAEKVISGDFEIDYLYREIEASVIDIQVRQQPVASDLRLLSAATRIVADLERSGDLAKNVAILTRRRYPNHVVPEHLVPTVEQMGAVALAILAKAARVIADRDAVLARELDGDDDLMDELHRGLLREVITSTRTDSVEVAVDLTLCGRYYERFADHAVSIAGRVIYLATGEIH